MQRHEALRVAFVYTAVLEPTVMVITGVASIVLPAKEGKVIYKSKGEDRTQAKWML